MTAVSIITEEALEAWCIEAARNPAFCATLELYPQQALKSYAERKTAELGQYSKEQSEYYRLIFPVFDAAASVLALYQAVSKSESITTSLPEKIKQGKESRSKVATLRGIGIDVVGQIFSDLGLGAHTSPGEWATALIALSASGCLTGNPYEIVRWFDNAGFGRSISRETLEKRKEWREADQYSNRHEKRLFKAVQEEISRRR